jgi:hypothetical protein
VSQSRPRWADFGVRSSAHAADSARTCRCADSEIALFKRTLDWARLAEGRRIHDLRHTAACLWLARVVDATTVQAWMGHASIATTNIYLHHLDTAADRAGLDRLASGGTRGARQRPSRPSCRNDENRPPERMPRSERVSDEWS